MLESCSRGNESWSAAIAPALTNHKTPTFLFAFLPTGREDKLFARDPRSHAFINDPSCILAFVRSSPSDLLKKDSLVSAFEQPLETYIF